MKSTLQHREPDCSSSDHPAPESRRYTLPRPASFCGRASGGDASVRARGCMPPRRPSGGCVGCPLAAGSLTIRSIWRAVRERVALISTGRFGCPGGMSGMLPFPLQEARGAGSLRCAGPARGHTDRLVGRCHNISSMSLPLISPDQRNGQEGVGEGGGISRRWPFIKRGKFASSSR